MPKADLQMGKAYFQRVLLRHLFEIKVNRHKQYLLYKYLWSQIELEYRLFAIGNQWINSCSVASPTTELNLSYFKKWGWSAIGNMEFREQKIHLENNGNPPRWGFGSRRHNKQGHQEWWYRLWTDPKGSQVRGVEKPKHSNCETWSTDLSDQGKSSYVLLLWGSIWACSCPECLGPQAEHILQKGKPSHSERQGTSHKLEWTNLL